MVTLDYHRHLVTVQFAYVFDLLLPFGCVKTEPKKIFKERKKGLLVRTSCAHVHKWQAARMLKWANLGLLAWMAFRLARESLGNKLFTILDQKGQEWPKSKIQVGLRANRKSLILIAQQSCSGVCRAADQRRPDQKSWNRLQNAAR